MLATATRSWKKKFDKEHFISERLGENIYHFIKGSICKLTNEYAEYAKSDAPKFTPSKTKANEFIGCVAATNCWIGRGKFVLIERKTK